MISQEINALQSRLHQISINIHNEIEKYIELNLDENKINIHIFMKEFLSHTESILDYIAIEITKKLELNIDYKDINFPIKYDLDKKEKIFNRKIKNNNFIKLKNEIIVDILISQYRETEKEFENKMKNRWDNSKNYLEKIKEKK